MTEQDERPTSTMVDNNQFFVCLPPISLTFGDTQTVRVVPPFASDRTLSLAHIYKNYQASGNPLYVIGAFCEALSENVYPAAWVMDYLRNAFNQYLSDPAGEQSLDALLGLRSGKGQNKSPLARFRLAAQVRSITSLMLHLLAYGVPIAVARQVTAETLSMTVATFRNRWKTVLASEYYEFEYIGILHDCYRGGQSRLNGFREAHVSAVFVEQFPVLARMQPPDEERLRSLIAAATNGFAEAPTANAPEV